MEAAAASRQAARLTEQFCCSVNPIAALCHLKLAIRDLFAVCFGPQTNLCISSPTLLRLSVILI